MGGTTTTGAVIPDELKGLFGRSANIMERLQQHFFTNGGADDSEIDNTANKEPKEPEDPDNPTEKSTLTEYPDDPLNLDSILLKERPDTIAGMSEFQKYVGEYIPKLLDQNPNENWAKEMAGKGYERWSQPLNVGVEDPYVQASKHVFDTTMAEDIKNQMSLSGLGRSTAVGDSLSKGWASMLLPAIQQGTDLQKWQREGQAGYIANTIIPTYMDVGARERAGLSEALTRGTEYGALQRGIEQEGYNAEANERNRLRMLGEQSLFGPFGSFVPSTIGSRTSGGGLFK